MLCFLVSIFIAIFGCTLVYGDEAELKFISGPKSLIIEDIDFTILRMKKLLAETPDTIEELRPLIANELNESSIYKAAWDEGIEIFKEKHDELVDENYPAPDEYHIALIAYSLHDTPKDKPFFSDFNKLTRELCSGQQIKTKFPYKTFFKLLHLAIETLGKNPKFQFPASQAGFYRGFGVEFVLEKGQQVAFQHYLSVTANLKRAEEFAHGTILFELPAPLPHSIKMMLHSKFPYEEENLVSPLNVYKVVKIVKRNGDIRVFLEVVDHPNSLLAI